METFSELLAICAGNSPVSGEFPAQKPVTQKNRMVYKNRKITTKRNVHKFFGVLYKYCTHEDLCARSRYLGHGQIITSHGICGVSLLLTALDTGNTSLHIINSHGHDYEALITCKHDDVIKWKHFPSYWPFVREIHRSPVNSPHKGQWRRALIFSLISMNVWVNTHYVRHYFLHYCPLCGRPLVVSPHKGPVLWTFPLLLSAWTSFSANSRITGVLRRRNAQVNSLQWRIYGYMCMCLYMFVFMYAGICVCR